MKIQVLNGKVTMMKMFSEDEIFSAQCLGFTVNDNCDTVVAYINKTAKEAMLEFLKKCDRGLIESPAQSGKRAMLFKQLKEEYNKDYKIFIDTFKPHELYNDVNRSMYAHQVETLWKYTNKPVNLCSFEQGLGKTIFAASVSKLFNIPRTIVVCPSLVKWNWVKDLGDEWGYNTMFFTVYDSKKIMEAIMHERFVIINYEMVNKFFGRLISKDCGHIILDECHMAKNYTSMRSKAVQKLVKKFPKARVTLLTGTPVTNRVTDLFAYLKIAGHPLGKNFTKFKNQYAVGKQKITGVKNSDDLRLKISNFLVRKKSEECLDLPELRINKYYFDMQDKDVQEYNDMMKELYDVEQRYQELQDRLKQHKSGDIFLEKEQKKALHDELRDLRMKKSSSIHTMNRICATSKVPNIIKLTDNLIEQEEKVVIFSGYSAPIHALKEHYGDMAVVIDGSVPAFKRQELINRFIEDDSCKVFIGQFQAAGIGINLVNSRKTIFTNFPFTPDQIEQPMKRSHRGGQKRDVDIFFTIIPDSIDERIYQIIKSKGDDINEIIDHGKEDKMEYGSIEDKLFDSLFKKYEEDNNIEKSVVRKFKTA